MFESQNCFTILIDFLSCYAPINVKPEGGGGGGGAGHGVGI